MKAGFVGSLATRSSASCKVPLGSGLASALNPIWLSLIWTKLKSAPFCASAGGGRGGRGRPQGARRGRPPPRQGPPQPGPAPGQPLQAAGAKKGADLSFVQISD